MWKYDTFFFSLYITFVWLNLGNVFHLYCSCKKNIRIFRQWICLLEKHLVFRISQKCMIDDPITREQTKQDLLQISSHTLLIIFDMGKWRVILLLLLSIVKSLPLYIKNNSIYWLTNLIEKIFSLLLFISYVSKLFLLIILFL